MMKRLRLHKYISFFLSVALIALAVCCLAVKIRETEISLPLDFYAAETVMPVYGRQYTEPESEQGEKITPQKKSLSDEESSDTQKTVSEVSAKTDSTADEYEYSTPSKQELKEYKKQHSDDAEFPVNEMTITEGNVSYKNIQVKNASSADIDIKAELDGELGFDIDDTDEPQVLIYHTHTSESFLKYDTGSFYEGFYPRTTEKTENVCAVGEQIARQLNAHGIKTIHDTTIHDYPSYNGAYDRSYETIQKYLKKYPSIKVTLDIHRDGIGTDTEKSKPVFEYDGKKAAQIMILSGYNYDGCEEFKDWEYNLRFALQIQSKAVSMYPNMVRPLYFADFMYNMNVNTGSLLIEIGAESNTIEEVKYSGYLLGNVLSEVLLTKGKEK